MAIEQGIRVVIVGGGAAGTLAAHQLARFPSINHITLVDGTGRFGRGLAYSAVSPWHRLNVPVSKMGGSDDDDPDGFGDWLRNRGYVGEGSYESKFVARRLYGDYLCELIASLRQRGVLTQQRGKVAAIARDSDEFHLTTAEGDTIAADAVVLCLGNQPPSAPPQIVASPRYVNDVWAPGALDGIEADDDVLVVGTGATAVDAVLDLAHRGVGGAIRMVSRRGLLPLVDVETVPDPKPLDPQGMSLRTAMRALREDVADKAALGLPWQSVIDAFRPAVSSLWSGMSNADRGRFLRHLRSIWLVHRHRMAPDVGELLATLAQDKRLRVIAGRLKAATPTEHGYNVTLQPRGQAVQESLATNWILNCTGPEENYRRLDDELVRSLLDSGRARLGAFGLGLDVDQACRLVDARGQGQSQFYLIGSATRGRFWEVTAVPSIRAQAATVARHLDASFCEVSAG